MENNHKGQWVKAINVAGIKPGTTGIIQDMDLFGRFMVKWSNGRKGIIKERGEVYNFIYPENSYDKKFIWNFKSLFLNLLNKLN